MAIPLHHHKNNRYPLKQHFSVSIRHDLDNLDTPMLKKLIEYETSIGIRSTLFVLADQLRDPAFNEVLFEAKKLGFDIQLHSEIKRSFFQSAYIRRPISAIRRILLYIIPFSGYTRHVYKKKLIRYTKILSHISGHIFTGHAPHNKNCYLRYWHHKNWDIIEQATAQSELLWLSDYRAIVHTAWGKSFPSPQKSYRIKHKKHSLIVFPTCWDDRYTFAYKSPQAPKKSMEEIIENIQQQITACAKQDIPCVISLHPLYFVSKSPRYSKKLLQHIKEKTEQLNGTIMTIQKVYQQINQ